MSKMWLGHGLAVSGWSIARFGSWVRDSEALKAVGPASPYPRNALWMGWGQRASGHSVSPEQMGRILQRTAISTNIKERLDFSCALFGPDGGLVSNAPHIPVHLGAMQETVQFQVRRAPLPAPRPLRRPPPHSAPVSWLQIQHLGADLHPGDVLLSNHPCAGGSHLPDLTVITPVRVAAQVPWVVGPPAPLTVALTPRCFGRVRRGLCSTWPAVGTTRTLGASHRAPCPPTPPPCSRRAPSFCPSDSSRRVSSRRRVSGNGSGVGLKHLAASCSQAGLDTGMQPPLPPLPPGLGRPPG